MEPSDKVTQVYRPIDSIPFVDYLQPVAYDSPASRADWANAIERIQKMAKNSGKIVMVCAQVRK